MTGWRLGLPVAHTAQELKDFISEESRNKEAKKRFQEVKDKYDVKISVEQYKNIISNGKK